jgi:hypothetical protein
MPLSRLRGLLAFDTMTFLHALYGSIGAGEGAVWTRLGRDEVRQLSSQ